MQIINNIEQGSDEWQQMRIGMITASKIKDLLTNGRAGKPSKTAETYMYDLIAEKLTNSKKEFFVNDAMQWGIDTEEQARLIYELNESVDVEQVAFIKLDENVGVSPDGLIGENGMLEIKCPNNTTQLKRAMSGCYSADYKAQIQCQLWVADREWCDFLSYDPRLNCEAHYLLERVYRDDEFIENMIFKVKDFIKKMNEILAKLK